MAAQPRATALYRNKTAVRSELYAEKREDQCEIAGEPEVRTIARRRQADPAAPHVVICGAGFGGLSAISRLTRAGMRVTLVDGHLYSTFQPLLYQVATAG